jgi:uncharacterized protein (TIGR02145 family)
MATGNIAGTGTGTGGVDQVQDADGNWYNTVQIGTQIWMAEDLNVGTMVNGAILQTDNSVIEKYCYANNLDNCASYGGLYQWDEMMQYSITEGVQGICPTGWHLPTDTEWKTMEMVLGMSLSEANTTSWRGTVQGDLLKSGGGSGFEGMFTGMRTVNGTFSSLGNDNWFWSSTETGTSAWYRLLTSGQSQVLRNNFSKNYGQSVRCVKD